MSLNYEEYCPMCGHSYKSIVELNIYISKSSLRCPRCKELTLELKYTED